jgi:23S rRNA pseudouridine2605 synthase
MSRERLQKILAHAGVASRRAAEALITSGHVRVNGRIVTELGASADSHRDKIEVDGKRVVLEKPRYLVLHKPRGMVTTLSDPEGRPHLGQVLERAGGERLYPIGRLDFHTSGVLLVTNDGELTEALLHPRKEVPKIYVAKMRGHLALDALAQLRNGVVLDDGTKTKPAEAFVLREEDRQTWVQITLFEGKNRQIHRMGDAIGHPVLRLARTSFAGIDAEGLRPGEWRELTANELEKLKKNWITPLRRTRDKPAKPAQPPGPAKKTASRAAKPPFTPAPSKKPDDRSAKRPFASAPAKKLADKSAQRPFSQAPANKPADRSAKPPFASAPTKKSSDKSAQRPFSQTSANKPADRSAKRPYSPAKPASSANRTANRGAQPPRRAPKPR